MLIHAFEGSLQGLTSHHSLHKQLHAGGIPVTDDG